MSRLHTSKTWLATGAGSRATDARSATSGFSGSFSPLSSSRFQSATDWTMSSVWNAFMSIDMPQWSRLVVSRTRAREKRAF